MRVLVCGASGFIGRAVCARLVGAGHEVLRGVRRAEAAGDVAIDYSGDLNVQDWLQRLRGVDAVVNAVGIIAERPGASFDQLHARAPCALFAACAAAGVRRVVQISALGAEHGASAYFVSKRAADRALMTLDLEWTILRPALVFGLDGTSTALFCRLASLPLLLTPALPGARFQPVHLDDLAHAVAAALAPAAPARQVLDIVGATALSFDGMLAAYRRAMSLPPALVWHVPASLMACVAWLAGKVPAASFNPDTWRMLRAGSALAPGSAAPIAALTGRAPRAIAEFMTPGEGELLRLRALAAWRGVMLRWVLAIVWLATALVSAFIYPRADSLALLARVGLEGWPALLALDGAAALDALLGLACLAWPRRALWLAQGALVAGYSVLIGACLPEFLWHPFGPVLKNLPILAILLLLHAEEKAWTT